MSSSAGFEAPGTMQFNIIKAPAALGPRLGRLAIKGRKVINTPHYVATTSRGVVPHLSQDTVQKHTALMGVYVALEDFIERVSINQTPPVLCQQQKGQVSPLRSFIALPDDQFLILGARRTPPVTTPWSNTQTALSISTAFGFGQLKAEDYTEAATMLKPDVVVALGDVPHGEKAGSRRIEKMGLRTERWLKEMLDSTEEDELHALAGKIFAPILPVTQEQQALYLDILADEWRDKISGLAIYDADVVADLAEPLASLPRLSLTETASPGALLREISLGLDIFTVPFLTSATDAGFALDFDFPVVEDKEPTTPRKALGVDMWAVEHSTDLSPLVASCNCYACTSHHKAYVRHLLSAKEMLAWVLLQIHNIHVVDSFFAGVRASITRGTFDEDRDIFLKVYEAEVPQTTGQGPRIRGYQIKTEGPGETKKNPKAYNTLDDSKGRNAEAPVPDAEVDAEMLEDQGFGKAEEATQNGG